VADAAIDVQDVASCCSAMERVRRSGTAAVVIRSEDSRAWMLDTEGLRSLRACIPAKGVGRDPFLAAVMVRLALGSGIEDAFHFADEFASENVEQASSEQG
jgi:hypothetical protein